MTAPTSITIRQTVLIPLSLLLLLLLFSFFYGSLWMEERHQIDQGRSALEQTELSFLRELDEEAVKLSNILSLLSANECLREHWLEENWRQLIICSKRLQQDLYDRLEIVELNLIDPDQHMRLKGSTLENSDELVDNFLMTRVVNLQMAAAGLSLEPSGRLLFHSYIPWVVDEELTGYLEIGKEVDGMLEQLGETAGVGMVIYAEKEYLDPDAWSHWSEEQDEEVEWGLYEAQIPVINGLLEDEEALLLAMEDSSDWTSTGLRRLKVESRHYVLGDFPLLDEGGQIIGKVGVAIDHTKEIENSKQLSSVIGVITVLIGGMLVFFFYLYLGKTEGRLKKTMHSLHREIEVRRDLTDSLKKFSAAIENTGSAIFITDEQGTIEYINPRFTALTGYDERDVLGHTPKVFSSEETDPKIYQELWNTVLSGRYWRGELLNRKKSGERFWCAATISPILDETGKITSFVSINEDVTELKRSHQKIKYLANYDVLTQLPNRRFFEERFRQAVEHLGRREGDCIALMLIDLDHFKEINDTMGHDAGDQLLVEVASRLSIAVRKEDTAARLGGDEFVVLLERIGNRENAEHVANNILDAFVPTVMIDGEQVTITCSIGITVAPEDGNEHELLMRNADHAMYQAKQEGRNGYISYCSAGYGEEPEK